MSNTEEISVAILLSTYNGEKYIGELLQSLADQDYKWFHVYMRDDGSTDATVALARNEAVDKGLKLTILDSQSGNLGPSMSFFEMVYSIEADIYLFCDQDDVWMPHRVRSTVDALAKQDAPALAHADLQVVDDALNEIASSFYVHEGYAVPECYRYERLLAQNYVVGCASGFNRALRNLVTSRAPLEKMRAIAMHDWWFALVACVCGKTVHLDGAAVRYRQHAANVSGVGGHSLFERFKRKFRAKERRIISRYRQRIATQAAMLESVFGDCLSEAARAQTRNLARARGRSAWLYLLRAMLGGVRTHNLLLNIGLLFSTIGARRDD